VKMLVLSRQRDETIMIGDDIELIVDEINGDKVRLRTIAPPTVPIHRKEVYEAIQRELREAAKVKMEDLQKLPGQPEGALPVTSIGPRSAQPAARSDKEGGGLVLSRQRDEVIMIGDDIEVVIVDIRSDKVRLGITAPATIPVHRKEVYEAIQRQNRAGAKIKMEDLQKVTPNKPSSVPTPGTHPQSQDPPITGGPRGPHPFRNPSSSRDYSLDSRRDTAAEDRRAMQGS
jgi:carbon storage regulator